MVLDLIRVYLYEVAKLQFKNRVTQGIFIDILSIEPFLRKNINENITIEEFYKFGPPKLIKCDYLFDLWNNEKIENPRYDIKHVSQTTEDDLNLGPEAEEISHETRLFNKRALVKNKSKFNSPYKNLKIEEVNTDLKSFVKPETYLFDQDLLTLKKKNRKPNQIQMRLYLMKILKLKKI
ncbi:hypothetical protein NAPIS_ORF01746 [Vairimorpha apis BRL 01]|uniref:Uncharacterized protein n=1 Tax=Vairimorpha apis BRL 01 TaxID=1037528 RepID=T0L836_9MICR|nr:hypothetical protein NAPIS_ORF01746 [Vairimorpha apis BRL 01]